MANERSLLSEVNKALDRVGSQSGSAPEHSQDSSDEVMHEYFVSTIGESYFKKRREIAKKSLNKIVTLEAEYRLDAAVDITKETESGSTIQVMDGENFSLSVEIKNGATFLNMNKLRNAIMKACALNITEVDALVEGAKERRDPTQSWKVSTK